MEHNENEIVYLYLDDIIPNRFQPRQVFDEKALKELAVSIKEHGVIQPIIVRNIGNKYEIIAGERRYKASALAGLTKIPAIVRNLDDKESSKVALLENLQRKNLNPIEEARTYQKILEIDQMTQEELAKTMGKSQSSVANKIRLLSLTEEAQEALLKEQISERHARALLMVVEKDKQKALLKEVIRNKMTVRDLEDKIKQESQPPIVQQPAIEEDQQEKVISPSEIEKLLNSSLVPATEPITKSEISPATEFNQNVGIDYSTPPKFIDYSVPATVDDNLNSSAETPINIEKMRSTAQDINVEKPLADLDSLLKLGDEKPTIGQDDDNQGGGNFKFFQPLPEAEQEKDLTFQDTAIFKTPEPVASPQASPTLPEFNPLDTTSTPLLKDNASTSMDSLLAGVTAPTKAEQSSIPYLDTYNNPFARNPIFQDDIAKLEGQKQSITPQKPVYTMNESIDLVRSTVKSIEESGFSVDVEEMDFAKNYQIVIKITKKDS